MSRITKTLYNKHIINTESRKDTFYPYKKEENREILYLQGFPDFSFICAGLR